MYNAPETGFFCDILSLSHDGRGVARPRGDGGPVVFVAGALPGQRVRARAVRRKARYVEAVCLEVTRPAPGEEPPLCPHDGECGGCPLQRMPYAAQLRAKGDMLRQALRRIGGLEGAPVAMPLASPLTRGFRNKMEFAFGTGDGGRLLLGQRCRNGHGDRMGAAGFWRSAVLRLHWPETRAPRADDAAVWNDAGRWRAALLLLTSPGDAGQRRAVRRVAEALLRDIPGLTGVVHEERASRDGLALGERRIAVLGALPEEGEHAALLRMPLLGHCLDLDIASFFQVNTAAAQILAGLAVHAVHGRLPATAAGALAPSPSPSPPSLLDLYCGAGAPGLLCVDALARLSGVEYDVRATELAARNARGARRARAVFPSHVFAANALTEVSGCDNLHTLSPRSR